MLYLIGFMGVGKTTIGKKLSKKHNINFIDTDEEIERVSQKVFQLSFKETVRITLEDLKQ